jgi:hypothetical protein
MMMFLVLSQGAPKGMFAKQDQLPEAFLFYRSHPAFCVRIQIGTSQRKLDRLHANGFDSLVKRGTVFAVTIVNQAMAVAEKPQIDHGDIPRHWDHPLLARMGRKARNVDLPGSDLHEEEDVIRHQD